jgi:predicted nucleic acid-binding Zn ribbon protein
MEPEEHRKGTERMALVLYLVQLLLLVAVVVAEL